MQDMKNHSAIRDIQERHKTEDNHKKAEVKVPLRGILSLGQRTFQSFRFTNQFEGSVT